MLVDLAVKRIWQWFVLSEPGQQGHPVVKFERLFLNAKILIKVRNDLDELAHNVGEESHTTDHDENTHNFLDF